MAAEIEGRSVALVIDLRRVPLGSPALAPLWRCRLVGHNLSFDAKMLLANGIEIPDENVVDTILMSGLVLRGVADGRREGLRRPSLAEAVKEALGLELPKEFAAIPVVARAAHRGTNRLCRSRCRYGTPTCCSAAAAHRRAAEWTGRQQALIDRLCRAVMPVARMELAGVALNRDELVRQVDAWGQELEGAVG